MLVDYVEELRQCSILQIRERIRHIKWDIKRLKGHLENPSSYYRSNLKERRRLWDNWARLELAKKVLLEKGVSYNPTHIDRKTVEFNNNIPNISRMELLLNCFPAPDKVYVINMIGNPISSVIYSRSRRIGHKKLDVEETFLKIRDLYVCEMKKTYSAADFGLEILNGRYWTFEIEYNDGSELKFTGVSAYPFNWRKICELFGIRDYKKGVD